MHSLEESARRQPGWVGKAALGPTLAEVRGTLAREQLRSSPDDGARRGRTGSAAERHARSERRGSADMITHRPLMAYAFDPTHGRYHGNYLTLNVPYEKLRPGPIGHYLAVVDYDASNNRQYRPVDLDHPEILVQGGLEPSESDPRFHQQMVYAVASETIQRFKVALGRDIRWGFRATRRRDPLAGKLRIFPHAMQEANAYYDRELRALVFGYFEASRTDPGVNLPGQTVFTCLSHDIIAHETTHALVDGQRRFFLQPSGPDTPAFHEAFADIV